MTINLSSQNWLTTVAGFMAGIPAAVLASGMALTVQWTHIVGLIGALGVLLIGLAAKDATTHSTMAEVQTSTVKATATKQP